MKLLDINPLDIITKQGGASPSAVALAIYGLPPRTANKDIPPELVNHLSEARKTILSNVRSIYFGETTNVIRTDSELQADIVFGCAYYYKDIEDTPKIIKDRIQLALDNIYYEYKKNNEWERYYKAFCGVSLINKTKMENKKGQGNYRKNDELTYSYKLAGLLLELIKYKCTNGFLPSDNYSDKNGKTIQKNIYDDICLLAQKMNIDLIGIGRSSFNEKILKIENILDDYTNSK